MIDELRDWAPIYHISGCGQPAFYRKQRPYRGDVLLVDGWIRFPDGSEPIRGEAARCGSCGDPIAMDDLAAR